MKTSFLSFVVLALLTTLTIADEPVPFDPAAQYLEAFLALQDGDNAMQQSNWSVANNKFTAAKQALDKIKAEAPTWNPKMVEFRLNYCTERLTTVVAKLPPPLTATIVAPPKPPPPPPTEEVKPATPSVEPPKPPVEEVKPSTPPAVEDVAQVKVLQEKLAATEAQVAKAKREAEELSKQNQDLSAQLAEARKPAPPAPTVEPKIVTVPSPEDAAKIKALQDQLAVTESATAKAKREADELARKNADLNAQLAAAHKPVISARPAEPKVVTVHSPEDAAKIKALENKVANTESVAAKAKREAEELRQRNEKLAADLAAAKRPSFTGKPAEPLQANALREQVTALEAQLAKAKHDAADLERRNKNLNAQLVAAAKPAPTPDRLPVTTTGNRGVVFQAKPVDDKLEKENAALEAQLDKARAELAATEKRAAAERRSAKNENAKLQQENKELAAKVASIQRQGSVPQPARPAAPDSPAVKQLQRDLEQAHAQADRVRRAADARANELALENKQLNARLTEAERAEKASDAHVAEITRQNKQLSAQLAEAQRKPATVVTDTAEVTKLRAELQKARAEAERAEKAGDSRVAELTRQNKDLNAELAAAKQRPPAVTVVKDAGEVEKLRAELAEAKRAQSTTVAALEKQNVALKAELAEARKQPPPPREPADLRRLRTQLEELQVTATKNTELMQRLREENSFLRNLLETYAARNPELKGQLRRSTPTPTEPPKP